MDRKASPIVAKGGKAPIIQKGQLEGLESYAFGKAKWEMYFGDVGEEPPLPPNIHEILAESLPVRSDEDRRGDPPPCVGAGECQWCASDTQSTRGVNEKTKIT